MISEGLSLIEISKALNIEKTLVSYCVTRTVQLGYVKELARDRFKIEITQAGKNFLGMYQDPSKTSAPICRAEGVRFKAPVYKMPSSAVDWHKVELHNWNQNTSEADSKD